MLKTPMPREAIATEKTEQPTLVAKMTMSFLPPRIATVLFGLEREDRPGSLEDVVDLAAKFDASLNTIYSSRQDSSGQVHIYGNLDIEREKISAFREQLGRFDEILYFKSIE